MRRWPPSRGGLGFAPGSELQGGLAFLTRPIGAAGQALTERARLDSAGNFGIGTAAPLERLDVAGNIKASGTGVFGGALMVGGQLAANQTQKAILDYDQTDRSVLIMAYSHDGTAATVGFWSAAANGGATRVAFLDASGNLSHTGGFAVFNKAKVTTAPTVPAAATDAASTQTLANALRAALISYGLVQ